MRPTGRGKAMGSRQEKPVRDLLEEVKPWGVGRRSRARPTGRGKAMGSRQEKPGCNLLEKEKPWEVGRRRNEATYWKRKSHEK